jgi:hypothetical protein
LTSYCPLRIAKRTSEIILTTARRYTDRVASRGARRLAVLAMLSVAASCQAPGSRDGTNRSDAATTQGRKELATVTWGAAVNGLSLGVSTNGPVMTLYLKNVGTSSLDVMSHVQAHEVHLDWYSIELKDGQGTARTLKLSDSRERSAPVKASLGPGETLEHSVAIVDWAARPVNGGAQLPPAEYSARATYVVSSTDGVWNGRLEAGPVTLVIK